MRAGEALAAGAPPFSGSVPRAMVEVVACFAQSRRCLSMHAHGHIGDDRLAWHLQAIESRIAVLRRRHAAADLLVELLGHPRLLGRPVAVLLALALGMSAIAWLR